MVTMRIIGANLDTSYREDLNYNFGLLSDSIEELINGGGQDYQAILDMINNLQAQINALSPEGVAELIQQINDAIQNAETATAAADAATTKANTATVAANTATTAANTATTNALQAIQNIQNVIDSIVFKRTYSPVDTYEKNNSVAYNGSSYIYINDTPASGNPPPDLPSIFNNHWYMTASKGLDGAGAVSKVNNISPDGSGNVQLTAANVGAAPVSLATQIANATTLGLIKPDDVTLKVDPATGVATVVGGGGGTSIEMADRTVTVGPGKMFPTIQGALDSIGLIINANATIIISVAPGSYTENLRLGRSQGGRLVLRGEDAQNVILNGTITCSNTSSRVSIQNLSLGTQGTGNSILITNCFATVSGIRDISSPTLQGNFFYAGEGSTVNLSSCQVTNRVNVVYSSLSSVICEGLSGSNNTNIYTAIYGATIVRQTSATITGTTLKTENSGGKIIDF